MECESRTGAPLAGLIASLELGPAHVGGLSWGGTVALELYRLHPELVSTLILLDTYAGWKGSLAADVRPASLAHAIELMAQADLTPLLARIAVPSPCCVAPMVSSFTVALFVHLLGVLVFAAGIAVAAAAFELARRRDDAAEIALVLKLARAGAALVGPGSLLVLGGGLWLVDASAADFGSGWLDAALALFVVAFVLGGLGGRRPKRARQLAELRALLDDPLSLAANYASALLVLVILGLMVFKP